MFEDAEVVSDLGGIHGQQKFTNTKYLPGTGKKYLPGAGNT